jgi:hypothetical protein
MRPACLIAPECVKVYGAGVRLSQTLILHDYAITIRDGIKFAYVRSALDRLMETFDSLARSECGFTFSPKKAKKKLDRAYEIWVSWQMSGADPDDGESPLREVLEGCHNELDNMLTVVAKSDYLGRSFMTTDDSVDFEPDYSLRTWFHLGLAITRGVYNGELHEWQWDDQSALDSFLRDLGIQLSDVFFGVEPRRITSVRFPGHLAGWENIETSLEELRHDRNARLRLANPDQPIPNIAPSEETRPLPVPTGDERRKYLPGVVQPAGSLQQVPEHWHSETFREVRWDGETYFFTVQQASLVKYFWLALEQKRSAIPHDEIREELGVNRVRDVFKGQGSKGMHPAWGKMVGRVHEMKDMYALGRPIPRPTTPQS